MKFIQLAAFTILVALIAQTSFADSNLGKEFKNDYAKLVYQNYSDAYLDAKLMQKKINLFLKTPNDDNLNAAKLAWLKSRESYGQSEVFRFYEGPIDFADNKSGKEGPEGRLNAWPLDESYIDYVQGNEKSGLINDPNFHITKSKLSVLNQASDESRVSLGYHAIEFLLWGQDFSLNSAGTRPASDYLPINNKRSKYLKVVTNILVDDLEFLKKEWKGGWSIFGKNYANKFVELEDKKVLQNILTSLATLSGFELASERMATALDSGDQEDEHSCFSDNTHNDFIYNQKGIKNVFLGNYNDFKGVGVYDIIAEKDQVLADKILNQINETEKQISLIPSPIDSQVLATKKGSLGRVQMEKAVLSLQKQAKLFLQAAKVMGVDSQILN